MSHYLAPNGKPSNLTAEQYKLVRTKAFKDWFGDWENDRENSGKVSGITREPSVWYHSTKFDFLSKKGENIFRNPPFFFGLRKDISEDIVRIQHQNSKGRITTKAFFVRYKNPFDITRFRILSDKRLTKIIKENTLLNSEKEIKIFQIQLGLSNAYKNTWALTESKEVQEWIKSKGYDSFFVYEDGAKNLAVFKPEQIKLADGTNTTFDGSNPDIRYDDGGRVEDLIGEGIVDLKMYDTTPEHAKEYGLQSIHPLYIQTICVSEPKRLKGLGKKVLAYIEKYAIENGHDVVFGHITQKAKFTKDERETFFCDIDMIKNWLHSNGYAINDNNNDFHKVISYSNPDIRYADGGVIDNSNYFDSTRGDFEPISKSDAIEIMNEYVKWRRKKNKPEFIQSSKFGNLRVDYESEKKSAFWRSRSFSFYFVSEDNTYIIRISDHWSKSSYPKSNKLNCGFIRSCYWTNFGEERFDFRIPSETYSSDLLGGLCYFKNFQKTTSNPAIKYENGGTMKKVDKGGITYGNSHDDGGIPVKNASTGQMLEVEGGEGIVNKRSMASDKKVKINGKEMTICEAVSHLNQMEGGVRFSCDDVEHRQFIEQMELGGELERGKRTEREHIETLRKLYEKRLTPSEAVTAIAKEHIAENPTYYTDLSKMNKEEKRAHIAELKKNFVEKAKQGTKVKDGDVFVYPKMNKYTGFFDTMSKYQDEYKKAVSAHEKTVTEGLRVKDDKKIPKKEKEARLETLRQELIQDKTRLKEARQDLAKLPEMESPFYAPKLAEGGQIQSGLPSLENAQNEDIGSLIVKPIKDDVSLYKFPKTGFSIDWAHKLNGTIKFGAHIGKRSIGNEVVIRLSRDNYQRNVIKDDGFLKIISTKSYYIFEFECNKGGELFVINLFLNFLRFNGNQRAFFENYDPTTQSVYEKGGGQQEQEEIREPLAIIANAVAEDMNFFREGYYKITTRSTPQNTEKFLVNLSNLGVLPQKELCNGLVEWKRKQISFDNYPSEIKQLCFKALDFIKYLNARYQVYLAFEDSDAGNFSNFITETLKKNLNDRSELLRIQFKEAFDQFNLTRYSKFWIKGRNDDDSLEVYFKDELVTLQAIYFLYLLKK